MAHFNKTDKKALWAKVFPALSQAWYAFELLHGIPASVWPEQEEALFDINPNLYRDYVMGKTPAMQRGSDRTDLENVIRAYRKAWSMNVLLADLKEMSWIKIQQEK